MCIYPAYVWMKIVDNAVATSETATTSTSAKAQGVTPASEDRPPRLTPTHTSSAALGAGTRVVFTPAFKEEKRALAWITGPTGLAWKQGSSLQCLIYVSRDEAQI